MGYQNGKESWMETFWLITKQMQAEINSKKFLESKWYSDGGMLSEYTLAVSLADEFEKANKGRDWDGEWIEEIEKFVQKKMEEIE